MKERNRTEPTFEATGDCFTVTLMEAVGGDTPGVAGGMVPARLRPVGAMPGCGAAWQDNGTANEADRPAGRACRTPHRFRTIPRSPKASRLATTPPAHSSCVGVAARIRTQAQPAPRLRRSLLEEFWLAADADDVFAALGRSPAAMSYRSHVLRLAVSTGAKPGGVEALLRAGAPPNAREETNDHRYVLQLAVLLGTGESDSARRRRDTTAKAGATLRRKKRPGEAPESSPRSSLPVPIRARRTGATSPPSTSRDATETTRSLHSCSPIRIRRRPAARSAPRNSGRTPARRRCARRSPSQGPPGVDRPAATPLSISRSRRLRTRKS